MPRKKSESESKPETTPAKKAPRKATAKSPTGQTTRTPTSVPASAPSTQPSKAPSKATVSKGAAKQPKSKPALVGAGSLIDTNLAASAAASLLLARRKGRDQIDDPISIDQIKSDLTKHHSTVAGEVLDQHAESSGGRRPNLPFSPAGGNAPSSQTVGHAAERAYVPRRTSG